MESALDWHQAKALLEWYVELGVTDTIGDAPVDRYALDPEPSRPVRAVPGKAAAAPAVPEPIRVDWVAEAMRLAGGASTLAELAEAMEAFDGCPLKKGARNFVFADGNAEARVMVIGNAPDGEEDREGRSFVGGTGTLLDRMFGAIGLSRSSLDPATALYVCNVVPWRPPGDRTIVDGEIEMYRPFLARHIALANPDIIVPMGAAAARALLGVSGIKKARGVWAEFEGKPVLPTFHPDYLARSPVEKKFAWADLLDLQARLRSMT